MLQMERRTLPGESGTAGIDEVIRICRELASEDPTFRVNALQKFSRPGYEIPQNHELTRTLAESLSKVGGAPVVAGASFWTDAAILGLAGIPSVLFGPGGAGLHSVEEHVVLADVLCCRDTLVELTGAFC
jgi:acetylornithine deacetylase